MWSQKHMGEMGNCHIAFCVNDAYVPYITVTIKSIAENNRYGKVSIHILTDSITSKNRERLKEMVEGYDNMLLYVYEVDDTLLRDLYAGNFTIYTWYRILIPMVLPTTIDRVLYLDADTLVTANLSELFDIDMTNKSIAAVVEDNTFVQKHYERLRYESSKHYICTGVLLMNLDYWRENCLTDKMIEWAYKYSKKLKFPDQDAINYICQDTKILLPLRYGILQWFFTNDKFYEMPFREQLKDCIERPAIIHYAFCAPWYKDTATHMMYGHWMRYNLMLRHPVQQRYKAKGLLKLKLVIWDILHPFKERDYVTIGAAVSKIKKAENGC